MTNNTYEFLKYYIRYNRWVRAYYQILSKNKILVNSVPKSGTHLLMKALELTPGIKRAPIQFGRQRIELLPWCLGTCPSIHSVIITQYYAQKYFLHATKTNSIPIDSDSPFYLSEAQIRKVIRLIQPGWFAMGHLPYSPKLAKIIAEEQVKMILILRDPRDVIVSHANYLANKSSHYMYPLYKQLSKKDRMMASITGVPASEYHPRMASIRERLEGIIAWNNHASVYMTYFEKLIGPQGNGSRETQEAELYAIADHLGLQLSKDHVSKVTKSMYGGTRTFREGTSGRWQQDFDMDHRQVCKDLIGDYLVEFGYENDLEW